MTGLANKSLVEMFPVHQALPVSQVAPDPRALTVVQQLSNAGYQACFAGGCIRDFLRGICPKDWDVATSASPDDVEALFPKTVAVGKAFGVIVVVMDGLGVEVATFRQDSAESDGRRPDAVASALPIEDVQRRDFTINALLYDPVSEMILDGVGGIDDLEKGCIRAVGTPTRRFKEDALRLLRGIRFAAVTGFAIEPETLKGIEDCAALVSRISPERIGQELVRMITAPGASRALTLLDETGLLPLVLPEVAACQGVEQPPQYHPEGDVYTHTLLAMKSLEPFFAPSGAEAGEALHPWLTPENRWRIPEGEEREWLAWAVLLHDIGKPSTFYRAADRIRFHGHESVGKTMVATVLRRLRRPAKAITVVSALVASHMRLYVFPEMRVATGRRTLQDPLFPLHWHLARADTVASHGELSLVDTLFNAWLEELSTPAPGVPLLTGDDLSAFGYAPGPLFGVILEELQNAQLEGVVRDYNEACEWVLSHYAITTIAKK